MAGRNQEKLEGVRNDVAAVNGAAKVPSCWSGVPGSCAYDM